ncbi:hypothetical protein D1007_36269 [Hordeum vulgare]|nr:hypothetical protein D1007_36269 [Hordeum vulgare]
MHSYAKLSAKLLSMGVVEVPNLAGTHQSAFNHGRCLHDNYMLVKGTTKRLNFMARSTVMLKLDITKAFDMVDWDFLLEVLHHMEFINKWTDWVAGLLASSSTGVLVNGVPMEVIYNKCGL